MKLANLLYFDIGRNRIGGSIPEDIGTDFGDLKYFHINRNRLTGSIPDTIPLVADGRMISFLADHNRLGGAIPDNWLMFNKLVQYTLQGNYFDYLGPETCHLNVFSGGQCVEFKADCSTYLPSQTTHPFRLRTESCPSLSRFASLCFCAVVAHTHRTRCFFLWQMFVPATITSATLCVRGIRCYNTV